MCQCRLGYTVYCDERLKILFFGARVEGFHDSARVTSSKVPVYLTQRQFATLVRYDSQKFSRLKVESIVDVFSRQYDSIIRQIKVSLPRYDQESIVTLSADVVTKICNAVNALDDLKRATESFVFQQVPFSLFSEVSNSADPVFKSEDVCGICETRECENETVSGDFFCNMCAHGCSYCSFRHRKFYGMRVIGYYTKSLCKSSVPRKCISRFDLKQARQLIEEQVKQNEVIYSLRRFLHDIGQYLFGMGNLLPVATKPNAYVSCSATDIRSIAAFVSALKSLKREFFRYRDPVSTMDRRTFEPFPLFYKYRLCFECRDVKIEVRDLNQQPGMYDHETIEGPEGFEFVALNLISNAVKYLPRTESKYRTINIVLNRDVSGLNIQVSSWGPKVEKSEISFLGKRGFRSRDARKADSSGQGLGLSRMILYAKNANFEIGFSSGGETIVCCGIEYSIFKVSILIPSIFCRGRQAIGGLSDTSSSGHSE